MYNVFRTQVHNLEELSVTDINCAWAKKDIKKVFAPTPHEEYCCVPQWKKMKLYKSKKEEDDFKDRSFEKLLKHLPDSAVALHRYEKPMA
jgi:hypothetical protein